MIAASLQFHPVFLDVDVNLLRIEEFLRAVDAELAVLPELCSTGYYFHSQEQLLSVAESMDGRLCSLLRELALERHMSIVAGFAEAEGGRVYNSAVTVFPDASMYLYRKVHLFAEEKELFAPGDLGFPVAAWQGTVLGTMICYDWRFPESVRTLVLKGAQIICHPSNLVALPRHWKPVMQTRSFENKVYTITANRIGTETRGSESLTFHGCSQITDISGVILAETDGVFEGWITADLDPGQTASKRLSQWNDIFLDRRPEMYEL